MKIKRKCPLCGNINIDHIKSIDYVSNKIINGFSDKVEIVFCNTCSLIYNNISDIQSDFDNYYKNIAVYSKDFHPINSKEAFIYYNNIFNILSKYSKKDDEILDIGCGNGGVLKEFYKHGYTKLTGIDQSDAFNSIKEECEINFINDSILNIKKITNKKFNIVIAMQIIEHILELDTFIKDLDDVIDDNGILFLEVPNTKDYCNMYNLTIEHINHFSIESIINFARIYDYEILYINIETDYIVSGIKPIQAVLKKKKLDVKEKYLDFFSKIENSINYNLIHELEKSNSKIILWGIANTILPFINKLSNLNIIKIFDSSKNKQNKKILNHVITNPSDNIDEDAVILILPELYYDNIYNQIKEMGLKNRIEFFTIKK